MKKNILCIVASGSGGHISPALVLGEKWLQKNPDGSIIFFSKTSKVDSLILKTKSIISKNISLQLIGYPGKKLLRYPKFLFQLFVSFCKSFYFLFKNRPCKIITTGGYLSIPVCIAGRLLKVPVELFELNVIPGKAIKALSPFASKICVTFEKCKSFLPKYQSKCVLENYPMRYSEEDKTFDKNEIIKKVNELVSTEKEFSLDRQTIFLMGGSQGSIYLNDFLKRWIEKHKEKINTLQIIHQVGLNDKRDWKAFYNNLEIPAFVFPYFDGIKDFYLLSDLVICRGGAGTLFDLEFFQKPAVIIPLKKAAGHQIANAQEMTRRNSKLFKLLG